MLCAAPPRVCSVTVLHTSKLRPQSEAWAGAYQKLTIPCEYYVTLVKSLREVVPLQIKVLCNGIVDTLGRMTFEGRVNHPFTAHPKVDPKTGA